MAERQLERKLATWAAGLGVVSLLGVYERSLVKRDDLVVHAEALQKQMASSLKSVEMLLSTLEASHTTMQSRAVEQGLILRELQTTVEILVKSPHHTLPPASP